VQQCRDLGADEVIDYRNTDVATALSEKTEKYDFVLDNVGTGYDLYWKSPQFTKPGTKYVQIGAAPSVSFMYDLAFRFLMPRVLGGGKRPFAFGMAATNYEHFTEIGTLLEEGKVRPVIDEVFAFDRVPEAYRKLKTGHARGKLVVKVENVDGK
jgi:NADPH:quinone reductase-like Zn-dependent oxidoreductase